MNLHHCEAIQFLSETVGEPAFWWKWRFYRRYSMATWAPYCCYKVGWRCRGYLMRMTQKYSFSWLVLLNFLWSSAFRIEFWMLPLVSRLNFVLSIGLWSITLGQLKSVFKWSVMGNWPFYNIVILFIPSEYFLVLLVYKHSTMLKMMELIIHIWMNDTQTYLWSSWSLIYLCHCCYCFPNRLSWQKQWWWIQLTC